MSSPTPSPRLPELVGPPDLLEGLPRERWLDRVRACRWRLRNTWRQYADLSDQTSAAIDQFLGLLLLIRFVRDRQASVLPADMIGQAKTPLTLCQTLSQAIRSPLLKAVFDPTEFADVEGMGEQGWRAAAAIDLGWRDRVGRSVPLPPTAFGEFHQLCLADSPQKFCRLGLSPLGFPSFPGSTGRFAKGGKVTLPLFPIRPTCPLVSAQNLHRPSISFRQRTSRRFNSWACPSRVQGSVYFTGSPNMISVLGSSGSSRLANIQAGPSHGEWSSNLLRHNGQMRTTIGPRL